jgi:hypothetical protein
MAAEGMADYFSLVKIWSVQTETATSSVPILKTKGDPKKSGKLNGLFGFLPMYSPDAELQDPSSKQQVTISLVEQGGYKGHEFLAIYCSNSTWFREWFGEVDIATSGTRGGFILFLIGRVIVVLFDKSHFHCLGGSGSPVKNSASRKVALITFALRGSL